MVVMEGDGIFQWPLKSRKQRRRNSQHDDDDDEEDNEKW